MITIVITLVREIGWKVFLTLILAPPCTSPQPDTYTQESGLLCVHPSFWTPSWRPCQPYAHGHFLQEPAGVSRNTGCSGHFSCQDQDGTRRHLLVPELRQSPLLSLWRCFTCLLPLALPSTLYHVSLSVHPFLGSPPLSHQHLS